MTTNPLLYISINVHSTHTADTAWMFKRRKTSGKPRSKEHDLYVSEPVKEDKPPVSTPATVIADPGDTEAEAEWERTVLQNVGESVEQEFPTYQSVIIKLEKKLELAKQAGK